MFDPMAHRAVAFSLGLCCAAFSGCLEHAGHDDLDESAKPAEFGAASSCQSVLVVGYRSLMGPECRPLFDPERQPRVVDGAWMPVLEPAASETSEAVPAVLQLRSADGSVTCRRPAAVWGGPDSIETASVARKLREAGRPGAALARVEGPHPVERPAHRVWILGEKARALANLDRIDETLAALEEAHALALRHELHSEAARLALAAAYHALKRHKGQDGFRWVASAEAAVSNCPDPVTAAWIDYIRALLHDQLGDYRGARAGFERAAASLEELGLREEAANTARYELAGQHWKMGQYERAMQEFSRIEEVLRNHPSPIVRAAFFNDMAELYLAARPKDSSILDDSRQWLRQALAEWKKVQRVEGQAVSTFNLARVARRRGDLEAARRYLDEARSLSPSPDGLSGRARDLFEAELHVEAGHTTEAVERYRAVLEREARTVPDGPSEWTWRAHHGLARVFWRSGELERARDALDAALEHRRVAATRAALRDQQASLLAQTDDVFLDAIEVALELDDVAGAFMVADALLAEMIGAVDTQARWSRLSEAQRVELQRRLDEYRSAWATFDRERSEASELPAETRRARAVERRARRRELARMFDEIFAWLDEAAPPTELGADSVDGLRRRLKDDEALLSAVRSEDERFVFWLDSERLDVRRTSPDEPILGPWAERLDGIQHLHIVGRDAELLALPVRSMKDDRIPYEAVSLAMLPYAGALRSLDAPSHLGAVVVADPEGDLPQARAEGRLVTEALGGARLFVMDQATRGRVLEALSTASALHFAGHGILTPADPWDAHLRLADDQRLTLDDILVQRLPLRLVVLSGCETGKLVALSQRDGIGLADAFLAGGARTVLATSKRVRDEEAVRFMERFYAHDPVGQPAEALRRAALEDRAAGGQTWKVFRLFGGR